MSPLHTVHQHELSKRRDRADSLARWLVVLLLLLLLLRAHGWAQGIKPTGQNVQHVVCDSGCSGSGGSSITNWGGGTLGAMAAYGTSPGAVLVPGMNAFITNVPHIVCDSGCGGAASFGDNSAFTVGTTPVNVMAGYYTSGVAPALTSGNAARLRMDVNSYLLIDCVTGCFQTTQPVSGTFWQATQPVSGTFFQATQPVSIADGSDVTLGAKTDAKSTATDATSVSIMQVLKEISAMEQVPASTPVTGTFFQATQPVSGTVTANQGSSNATPWNENVAQFAGTDASTGTGASGAGIPRVTVSNDSQVRVLGNAGAIVDAANNAAAPANVVVQGVEVISQGTQPTAATSGNVRRSLASTEGVMYVQEGNSNRFSCFVQAVTVTTQCQAAPAAGLRAYVTSLSVSNQAATVQTLDVVFGTSTNCGTGTTALTHKIQLGTVATTTSPIAPELIFPTPLVPTAANAICVRPSAATAFGATLTGFIAP